MKTVSLFAVLVLLSIVPKAQNIPATPPPDSTLQVFTFVEQQPLFPGGDAGMMKFLQQNIRYPAMERDNDIQGKVLLRFVVNKDGSVSDVTVMRSASPGLDKEAVRVVRMLPKFTPGKQQGKAVKVYFNLPVIFKLQDNGDHTSPLEQKASKDQYFKEGLSWLKQNNYADAMKFFVQSVSHYPKDYLGYQYRGFCEAGLKKTKDACKDYKKAKELGSPDAEEYLQKNCK